MKAMYTLTLYSVITFFYLGRCQMNGYIGCYSDSETDRDLPYKDESFSSSQNARFENCLKFCTDNVYTYMGIQNGSECFCGPSYGKYGIGNICSMPCRDSLFKHKGYNPNETYFSCGGVLTNAVYGTGIHVAAAPASLQIVSSQNTSISVRWENPEIFMGNITHYQLTSVMVESFGEITSPSSIVVGAGELAYTIRNLKPASLYNITVKASIRKYEFGLGITNQSWTKVGVPEEPSSPIILSRKDSTMVVLLNPSKVTNGPVTAYQVVVRDNSFINLFDQNNLYDSQNASQNNLPYYITAQLTPEQLTNETQFVIGDSQIFGGFTNMPLIKGKDYSVKLGVISSFNGDSATAFSSDPERNRIIFKGRDPNLVLIPALSATLAIMILLLVAAIICFILIRRYYRRRRKSLDQELTVQENILNANGSTNAYYLDDEGSAIDLYSSIKELTWQIPRDQLEILDKTLGWGKYGYVYDGITYKKGHQLEAAVHKTKIISLLNNKDKQDLLLDLEALTILSQHRNVIGLIGIHEDTDNLYIVIENPSSVNLRDALRHSRSLDNYPEYARTSNRISTLTEWQLLETLVGIGYGMTHLTQNKIIHKTLASCHVLVVDGLTPKIADYGLTHFQADGKTFVPSRWQALESLKYKIFTRFSNVWSFGVVMWECITLGGTPYTDTRTSEIANRLSKGHRLPQPCNCSNELYQLILHCWEQDSDQRPDFHQLTSTLSTLASEAKEHLILDLFPGFQYEKYDHSVEYSV